MKQEEETRKRKKTKIKRKLEEEELPNVNHAKDVSITLPFSNPRASILAASASLAPSIKVSLSLSFSFSFLRNYQKTYDIRNYARLIFTNFFIIVIRGFDFLFGAIFMLL